MLPWAEQPLANNVRRHHSRPRRRHARTARILEYLPQKASRTLRWLAAYSVRSVFRSGSRRRESRYICERSIEPPTSLPFAMGAGNGWLASQRARALIVGSTPAFLHHAASSPNRWTAQLAASSPEASLSISARNRSRTRRSGESACKKGPRSLSSASSRVVRPMRRAQALARQIHLLR